LEAGDRSVAAVRRPPPRKRTRLEPYVWIAPALFLFFVFSLLPFLVGVWLSFVSWDGIGAIRPVGLRNYADVLQDGGFWQALAHNMIYALGTVAGKLGLGLLLAVLLNRPLFGRAAFRTALFLPVVLSMVVVGLLWSWIYNWDFGLANSILVALGLGALRQDWLGNPNLALGALIVVDIWKYFGFHMVIYLAGLQSIPNELYDVARIDGAGSRQLFLHITLPLLLPVTVINLVLATMGAFNVFDIVYVMTAGGPFMATNVAMTEIYQQAFQFGHFGYAASMSVVLFAVVSLVSLTVLRVLRHERYF
jgi:raffinose/stachyose/melibiose transport system permease protein